MNSKIVIDRDIKITISIAGFSVVGLCLILFMSRMGSLQETAAATSTITPFTYLLLATETYTPEPSLAAEETSSEEISSNEPALEATTLVEIFPAVTLPGATSIGEVTVSPVESTPVDNLSPTPIPLPTQTNIPPVINSTPTAALSSPTSTAISPTVDQEEVLMAGKYNDTDSRIEYDGDWTSELFGVDGAYEETLYISSSTDNTATFSFMGRQLVLGYFGSSDLGMATISIDGSQHQLNQASGNSWSSPQLSFGLHTVSIRHQTGDLIYVDFIEIRGSS